MEAYFNPHLATKYKELYDEAFKNGYFVKNKDGSVA